MKYLKLILIALLINTIISCDNFLETKSRSEFTEETVFTNLDFATKAVNGIYANFTSSYLYDIYFLFYRFDSDIEYSYSPNDGSFYSIAHYAATDGTSTLDLTWNYLYNSIERANICIDKLPVSPIWKGKYEKEARQLYGEAVTLRAWCYYELITHWGDVPFVTKSTQAGDNFYLPKTDRDSIYEYLIKDLADVEDYVPWMRETNTAERINKGFVKGLRARMSLTYAGYSLRNKTFETRRGRYWEDYYKIANQECREIMMSGKHQLNPSFENIFRTIHAYKQDLTYNEVLFEIAFGRLYSGRLGRIIGMSNSTSDPKYGGCSPSVYVPPTYYYSFDRSDSRRDVSVALFDYSSTAYLGQQRLLNWAYYFVATKWRRSWIIPNMGGVYQNAGYTGINFPIMRYADVILMFAESENEINGTTQAAKEALSLIRQRAFPQELWASKVVQYVDSVSSSKEKFLNAIVDERAWEFGGGELIRKYDLVRWNLLGAKIKEMKEESQKIINYDPTYSHYDKIPNYIFWKYKADNETVEILNPDYKLPSTSIAGYSRITWMPLSQSNKDFFKLRSLNVANGYNASKNNHLSPISNKIITSSSGSLSNDQIP
jgi:hypothetical protein